MRSSRGARTDRREVESAKKSEARAKGESAEKMSEEKRMAPIASKMAAGFTADGGEG